MRRMITETDVEKLDSINPSEFEKLGAMQDPKTATANQVLTADGTGKAIYKDATGKKYDLSISNQQTGENYCDFHTITDDNPIPGFMDSYLYCDINTGGNAILDFQVLSIQGQSQTYLMNTLIAKGILITYPFQNTARVFISADIAYELEISDNSSVSVRYTYRTIQLYEYN